MNQSMANGIFIFTAYETEAVECKLATKFTSLEPEAEHLPCTTLLDTHLANCLCGRRKRRRGRKKCLYRIRKKLSVEGSTEYNQ